MEERLFTSQLPYIEEFAKIWLDSGANSYELWTNNTQLAGWSRKGNILPTSLTAEIRVDSTRVGELRLSGSTSPNSAARLKAEAGLISSHANLERDLNGLAGELIDTRDQLLALFNLSRATRTNFDLVKTLEDLTYESAKLLKSEGAFLLLKMGDGSTYLHQYPLPILDDEQRDNLLHRLLKEGNQYLCINEAESELLDMVRNLLLVPIPVREATQVVLGVINKTGSSYLTPDIKLAKAIADFAGAHIENILLFQVSVEQAKLQAEMELAHEVQIRFLPSCAPTVPDLEVWAASRPASHVGGDFYDFISGPEDMFDFFVGDISGKGMPAALLVAMIRTALRTELNSMNGNSPHKVLDWSNHELYEDFNKVGMFATVFIGRYDPHTHQLYFGNAGHSPVIYSPAGAESVLLKADSMPIGIMSTRDSEDQCLRLGIGDVVVIGTDGLVDAQNKDMLRFGHDRFRKRIEHLAQKTPKEIGEGLISCVDDFVVGEHQGDDQTLVILKRTN